MAAHPIHPRRLTVVLALGLCGGLVVVWWLTATVRPPGPRPTTDPWDSGLGDAGGRAIFASCASCHLADASGRSDGSVPRLAGQRAGILAGKLRRIARGEVDLPAMAPFARSLEDAEIDAVARWLAALPDPPSGPLDPRGAALYGARCAACHGARGEGSDALDAPRLSGQHAAYLLRRMGESAALSRGDANPVMAEVVAALPDPDRRAVATFLAANPAAGGDR